MSAHAEAHHGHEAEHGNESAVEELFSGIGKIINSVRLAFKNIWDGAKGIGRDFINGVSGESHGDHGGHDAHGHGGGHGGGHH